MPDYKILHGILALIDIVNFTPQATKLGEENTKKYTAYFQEKVTAIAGRHGFRVIKAMGDAVLIFGSDAEDFLEIMLDLFEREKLEDRYGFVTRYRMVGHSGFFQFQMEGGRPVDLKETRILYDALASLCYQLFYESADGTVQRSVNEETLLGHFCNFIRERFRRDHLLLQAGKQEYVFVHATVMEFLAAYFIVEKMQRLKKPVMDIVRGNYLSVHWIYLYLKELVSSQDKEKLGLAVEQYELPLKLSRAVLLEEYLDYAALMEGDTQLAEPRRGLLAKLVQKEPLEQWLKAHQEKEVEVKNFTYYKGLIGPELVGFFGSPNISALWDCAFSPEGTHLVSASSDETLKLWEVESGACIKTLTLPWMPLFVTFSPTSPHQVATANKNGTLTLFDLL